MEVYKNRHGKVTLTLVDGKWVRPGTSEVDSSAPPPRDWSKDPIRVAYGARPTPGSKSLKPSDDLLRSLNREVEKKNEAKKAERRERLAQIDRDLQSGKRQVDSDVGIGTARFTVPTENGGIRIVREDKVPEAERERIERQREVEAAMKNAPPVTTATPADDSRVGIFEGGADIHENTTPAGRDNSTKALDDGWHTNWTPSKNPGRRCF